MIWVSGSETSRMDSLLNECHWNLVVASCFAWKKSFRNLSDLILSCRVEELKLIARKRRIKGITLLSVGFIS